MRRALDMHRGGRKHEVLILVRKGSALIAQGKVDLARLQHLVDFLVAPARDIKLNPRVHFRVSGNRFIEFAPPVGKEEPQTDHALFTMGDTNGFPPQGLGLRDELPRPHGQILSRAG